MNRDHACSASEAWRGSGPGNTVRSSGRAGRTRQRCPDALMARIAHAVCLFTADCFSIEGGFVGSSWAGWSTSRPAPCMRWAAKASSRRQPRASVGPLAVAPSPVDMAHWGLRNLPDKRRDPLHSPHRITCQKVGLGLPLGHVRYPTKPLGSLAGGMTSFRRGSRRMRIHDETPFFGGEADCLQWLNTP